MDGGGGVESMMAKVALECGGDISASQEEILSRSSFLGDTHVPVQPPLTQQGQGQGQGQEEEDPITMCTLPFTQSQPPAPPDDQDDPDMAPRVKPRRTPRVCTRKVRGARIRTPTPSPSPEQQQQHVVDPLYRAVLMIPTATATAAATKQDPVEDFLALARHRGLF